MNRDINILRHILKYCDAINNTLQRFGADFATFEEDTDFKNSISMSIMQIGELSIHLSEEFKKKTSTEVPWNLIRGMRNHYAHGYSYMDNKEIFETATTDIKVIEKQCQFFLRELLIEEKSHDYER